ncbi:MAG: glycosyltransferase family 87 protein, partial [Bacteroidota bacterium]
MRWAESAARGLRSLWRQPHLAVPAALSAAWLPLMPVYLAATFYAFALAEPQHFIVDYSWFHEAALRFFGGEPLYADPEYFYPPPAVLAFWPTTWVGTVTGYIASGPLIFAGLAACFVWTLRLWARETGEAIPRATQVALLIVGLGSGPVFQNLKYAQVSVLLLASALAFLHLVQRGRPGWGLLALAGGFWIKLLPLALAPLGLVRQRAETPEASGASAWRQRLRWAAGGVAGFVVLPLALLPWVPWRLYREYALERFPAFSGLTDQGGLSTSIQASITRLDLPIEVAVGSGMLPATPLATALAGAVGALVVGGALWAAWAGRIGIVRAGLVILAVLPAVVPLGWEHTFV